MEKNNAIAQRKHERMESEILNILNHALKFEIYDQQIKLASFTYVKLTNDHSVVYVYVDTFDRNKINSLLEKMNDSKGVFRSSLAQNMNIRRVPNLIFERDTSIDRVIKIESLLGKEIK